MGQRMKTVRLTMAQALARYFAVQSIDAPGGPKPLLAGCWTTCQHGTGSPLVEAFRESGDMPSLFQASDGQSIGFAAMGFTKASARRRVMACIDPTGAGGGHFVPAATLAHVNRLPMLFLVEDDPGSGASAPDALSLESFEDGTVCPSDCLRPVSRYFERIARPEQILEALPRALRVFTDASASGPVTLVLCRDARAETHDYPESFLEPVRHRIRRPQPDIRELSAAARVLERARKPLIIAGGGVRYSEAGRVLAEFSERHGIPIVETLAGKGVVPWDNPLNLGTLAWSGAGAGTESAIALAAEADLVLAIGTRLRDFSVGAGGMFANPDLRLIILNIASHDTAKHRGLAIVADAWVGIEALDHTIANYQSPYEWRERAGVEIQSWRYATDRALAAENALRPSIAQVIGAVARSTGEEATVVATRHELASALNRFGRASSVDAFHLARGGSHAGGEIANGLGVKMATLERDVLVVTNAADYLTGSGAIVTALAMKVKLTIIVLDDGADRSKRSTSDTLVVAEEACSGVDFVAHAASLGAMSTQVTGVAELETALARAAVSAETTVLVIETATEAASARGEGDGARP